MAFEIGLRVERVNTEGVPPAAGSLGTVKRAPAGFPAGAMDEACFVEWDSIPGSVWFCALSRVRPIEGAAPGVGEPERE